MFVLTKDVPFGIKLLWASVVRRAIFDYVLYKGVGSETLNWKRAFQYLFVEDQEYENGFSFEEVCTLFDWDPGYLRRLIVKLTRADIRRMENDKVRDDFVYDQVSVVVENTNTWEKCQFAVPYLPPSNYTKQYQNEMTPKLVQKEAYLQPAVPMVQWQVALA